MNGNTTFAGAQCVAVGGTPPLRGLMVVALLLLEGLLLPLAAQSFGDFTYSKFGGIVTINGYTGTGGAVEIPDTIEGLPVRTLRSTSFRRNTTITSLTIPDSVTSLDASFESCTGLTRVAIGNGVTSIGASAFSDCTSLVNVTIGSSVRGIDPVAFIRCSKLVSVAIPQGLIAIGRGAFDSCTSLASVTLPDSLTTIGMAAFVGCSSLTHLTIPRSVTTIGSWAFNYCSGLMEIEVAAGNTAYRSVDGVLFDVNLATLIQYPGGKKGSYTIPDGTTFIGGMAFQSSMGLTSVAIPASVTSIGSLTFNGCASLASALFEGDAPATFGTSVFTNAAPDFTIYYYQGRNGFSSPTWNGYSVIEVSRPANGGELTVDAITRQAGVVSVIVSGGKLGWAYELQRSLDFDAVSWETVLTLDLLIADGPLELTDPEPPAASAFYRVIGRAP